MKISWSADDWVEPYFEYVEKIPNVLINGLSNLQRIWSAFSTLIFTFSDFLQIWDDYA